jgi:hypothetical protein
MVDQKANEKAIVSVVLTFFVLVLAAYFWNVVREETTPETVLSSKLVSEDAMLGHAQQGDDFWTAWLDICGKTPSTQGCEKVIRVKAACTADQSLHCKVL